MTDRTPTEILANGAIRYGEYDSDGAFVQHRYLVLDDSPTQAGTPLSSGNLFSGQTQNTFPDGVETVNNALATLMDAHNKLSQPGQLVLVGSVVGVDLSDGDTIPLDVGFDTYGQYLFYVPTVSQSGTSTASLGLLVGDTSVFTLGFSGGSAEGYSGCCQMATRSSGNYLVTYTPVNTYGAASQRSVVASDLSATQLTVSASRTLTTTLFIYGVTNQDTTYISDDSGDGGDGGDNGYDVTIRTQAEFEALLASDTWLDAVSVCFVGDGGTLKFSTTDGGGIEIPSTVKNIQGLNHAIISVSNFSATEANAALYYSTTPDVDAGYWIRDISVECTGISYAWGFFQCVNLTGCNATVEGFENTGSVIYYDAWCIGFYCCENLDSCNASASANGVGAGYGYAFAEGFTDCKNLVNCSAFAESVCPSFTNTAQSCGFYACENLLGCHGVGEGNFGYGFNDCTLLANCCGTGTVVLSGGGTSSNTEGYGFFWCSYLSNCKATTTASTTGLLGGTNTYVDDITVG